MGQKNGASDGQHPSLDAFFLQFCIKYGAVSRPPSTQEGLVSIVLLAGPSAPLLHVSLVDDLSFPTLLLVDDNHPRSSACKLHLAIIACISPGRSSGKKRVEVLRALEDVWLLQSACLINCGDVSYYTSGKTSRKR